jgi:hypothetical protein
VIDALHFKLRVQIVPAFAFVRVEELAEKLNKRHGFNETKASIAKKFTGAAITAAFFLAAIAVMGQQVVDISDI